MRRIIIDPSIACTGVALFGAGELKEAAILRPAPRSKNRLADLALEAVKLDWSHPNEIYVEKPQLRARGRGAKPEDLFKLSMAAGSVVGVLSYRTTLLKDVIITSWKGQLPKEVTHEHMWRVLNNTEREAAKSIKGPASLLHNAYDAICIGLFVEERATWIRKK